MNDICPFCDIVNHDEANRVIMENDVGFVVRDGFPKSPGNTLVIPRRYGVSFFLSPG